MVGAPDGRRGSGCELEMGLEPLADRVGAAAGKFNGFNCAG